MEPMNDAQPSEDSPRSSSGVRQPQADEPFSGYTPTLAELDRLTRPDSHDPIVAAGRAEAHLHEGNYEQALAGFDRAIELDSGNAWAYGSRGRAYRSMQRYDEAVADFDRALALDPADAWVMVERGLAFRLRPARGGGSPTSARSSRRIPVTGSPTPAEVGLTGCLTTTSARPPTSARRSITARPTRGYSEVKERCFRRWVDTMTRCTTSTSPSCQTSLR